MQRISAAVLRKLWQAVGIWQCASGNITTNLYIKIQARIITTKRPSTTKYWESLSRAVKRVLGKATEMRIKIPSTDSSFLQCNSRSSTPKPRPLHAQQWNASLPSRQRAGQTLKPDAQDSPIKIADVTVQHVKGPLFLAWIKVYTWQGSPDMTYALAPRD